MNDKQKRTFGLLVGIVAVLIVLLAAVVAVNQHKEKQKAAEADSSANPITDTKAEYTALSYTNSTATLSFSLNKDGKWYWEGDPTFPLDDNDVTQILDSVSVLAPEKTITNGDTLEAYGLVNPAITLTATESNGTQLTLALGNQVNDNAGYYLLLNGDKSTVYVVDKELHDELAKGIYDMMKLPDLPTLTEDHISSITISGKVKTALTSSVETAKAAKADSSSGSSSASSSSSGSSTTVLWHSGGTDVSANETVQTLVSEISSLHIDSCVDYKPAAKAASLCGFDAPRAVLTVQYTNDQGQSQSYTLTVANTNTAGDGCYVRVNDDSTIYSINATNLTTLLSVANKGLSS